MKYKPYSLLLHPLFLVSLGLLLLNDLYLKYQFHDELTGKLSDFTGLFCFAVFLSVIFPHYKKTVVLIVGLFFIWWKSPLSESMIIFFTSQLHLPVYRVIDYSDCIALLILPLIIYIKPVSYFSLRVRQVAIGCSFAVSLFAFTADSLPRMLTDNNKIQLNKTIRTKKNKPEIINAIENDGMTMQPIPAIYDKAWSDRYYVKSKDNNGVTRMIPVDSLYSGVYTRINYGAFYTIPKVSIGTDTLYNLEMIINEFPHSKTDIELHSFQYGKDLDSNHYSGYYTWRKFKGKIKKKFKTILK